MRYIVIIAAVILIIAVIPVSGAFAHGLPKASDDRGKESLSNYSVEINGKHILVFRYFNITNSSQPIYRESRMAGELGMLYWEGRGNAVIVPAINYSGTGEFEWNSQRNYFLYVFTSSYIGILLTDGVMNITGGTIFVGTPSYEPQIFIQYISTPFSKYGMKFGTYQKMGQEFVGLNSSFITGNNSLESFSLLSENTSLTVISSILLQQDSFVVATSSSALVGGDQGIIVPSDSGLPTIFSSALGSNVTLSFENFVTITRVNSGDNGEGMNLNFGIPNMQKEEYAITINHKTLGYAIVYGSSHANGSILSSGGLLSFVVIRFIGSSAFQANDTGMKAGNNAEVVLSEDAYYVPLSPNVSLEKMSFSNGILFLSVVHNESGYIYVVLEGNFSSSNLRLISSVGNVSPYEITREGNVTVIIFPVNGTGIANLTLSVSPISTQQRIGIFYLIVFITSLIVVALSTILLSRRKWLRRLEKE
ncbi:MAG: hypothetical protein ACP5UO_06080 [Thermoplasmata archaeon]